MSRMAPLFVKAPAAERSQFELRTLTLRRLLSRLVCFPLSASLPKSGSMARLDRASPVWMGTCRVRQLRDAPARQNSIRLGDCSR